MAKWQKLKWCYDHSLQDDLHTQINVVKIKVPPKLSLLSHPFTHIVKILLSGESL